MTAQPDHELDVLEDDQTVPPRPEEAIADAVRESLGPPAQEVAEDVPAATATPAS
jgi:hypothetical protein